MENSAKGTLYVVSTPIGNLGDISKRAIECLSEVSVIACEDTRHSGKLLSILEIKKQLVSYNDMNASRRIPALIERLCNGEDVALISDAGTPGISDPAYRIVRAAIDAECIVVAIPGASAVLSALVVSGLPLDRFVFEGFLPPKGAKRIHRIEALVDEPRTIVLYESPHKIVKLLEQLNDIFGDREISVSREITKLHEESIRGTASDVLEKLLQKKIRGEFTVVIRGVGKG